MSPAEPAALAARRARLAGRIGDLDALLVTTPANVRYLSGFTGSAGSLLLTRHGAVLRTDGRYAARARAEAGDLEVVLDRSDAWLVERLATGTRLGVEEHTLPWGRVLALAEALAGIDVAPAGRPVEALRRRKDPGELAAISRACALTAEVLPAVLGALSPGVSEAEVARRIADGLAEAGADGLAFPTIVASGPAGAEPHHEPGARTIEPGDLVTVDAGARVDGYAADMTRTVAVGDPGPRLTALYEAVRAAHADGLAAVAPGVAAGAVAEACEARLVAAGLAEAIAHPAGHGLGLEVHEPPILRRGEAATLDASMAVAVEPGAYVAGLGGVRIEDTVAVTDDGARVLTAAPTELIVC
ncbi:MAG: Xaa-Pro peptidase family protein [Egibacteraceae bacterium]